MQVRVNGLLHFGGATSITVKKWLAAEKKSFNRRESQRKSRGPQSIAVNLRGLVHGNRERVHLGSGGNDLYMCALTLPSF